MTILDILRIVDIENRYLVGEAMDVFALGSVFYARLIFKTPYPIPEKQEYQSGQNCTSLPAFVPSELKTLLARMTHTDCNKRITAVEGYNFINQYRIKLESK